MLGVCMRENSVSNGSEAVSNGRDSSPGIAADAEVAPPVCRRPSSLPMPRASELERASFRELLELLEQHHESELETLRLEISSLQLANCRERVIPESVDPECDKPVQEERCSVPVPTEAAREAKALSTAVDTERVGPAQGGDDNEVLQRMESVESEQARTVIRASEESIPVINFSMRPYWTGLKMAILRKNNAGAKQDNAFLHTLGSTVCKTRKFSMSADVKEGSHLIEQCLDRLLSRCMIDPSNTIRIGWSFLSVLLLALDMIFVPVDCFFQLSEASYLQTLDWISRVFWSLDMLLSFITGTYILGTLEMRPSRVIRAYLMLWFPVDLLLVASDWLSLHGLSGSAAGMIPLLRASRILRLLRLLKLERLMSIFDDVMRVMPDGVAMCSGLIRLVILIILVTHVIACCWYGIGAASPDGWAYDLQTSSFGDAYLRSVHWTVAQLHGTPPFHPERAVEHGVASATLLLGFVAAAVFIGNVAHMVTQVRDSNHEHLQQICRRYLRARKVSVRLQLRLNRYLASYRKRRSFKEQMAHEQELIQSLPPVIVHDLNEEVRKPVLICNTFLRDMGVSFPMLLRRICTEGLESKVCTALERVFYAGGDATSLLAAESGMLVYCRAPRHDERDSSYTPVKPVMAEVAKRRWGTAFGERSGPSTSRLSMISRGQFLSEAALWTDWLHMGDLVCETDATLLGLQNVKFEALVSTIDVQLVKRAVQYCKAFLLRLNELSRMQLLSDILTVDIDPSILEEPLTASTDHLVFLSHYKAEAGTEATLLREEMEVHIASNPMDEAHGFESPIFVDSEDLTDLSTLTRHVLKSHNLALLLTPGVLARPWCALEIVTAIRNNIPIVPIEIQRPGMSFKYPTEEFYQSLIEGTVFGDAGNRVLRENGVEAYEVAECVRRVFLKIAVPYSPHKASKIRAAEIAEILGRCLTREAQDRVRCSSTE